MLQEYKRKRDFNKTPEPSGSTTPAKKKTAKSKSLSFVIQKHAARRLHYDFRLEVDGVMMSWAVPKGPSLKPGDKRLAVMTEDHPMEYRDFEGIIPEEQYGAGEVIVWDRGTYSPDEKGDYCWDDKDEASARMQKSLRNGKVTFILKGQKLQGSWTLVKLHNKEKDWLLIKRHDEFENPKHDITEKDASVISGRTIEDLQQHGSDRIWTRKGEQVADPKTTGRSTKKSTSAKTNRSEAKVDLPAGFRPQESKPVKKSRAAKISLPSDFKPIESKDRASSKKKSSPIKLDKPKIETPHLSAVSDRSTAPRKPADKRLSANSSVLSVLEQLGAPKEKLELYVDGYNLPVTSLDKVYWPAFGGEPAITKRDYLKYLAVVSPVMVPHLANRMLTLRRFPNGINHARFYQKHWEHKLPPFVHKAPMYTESEGKDQDFLVCNNMATLLWLGQIADLEIHTSHTLITAEPDARDLPEKMTGSVRALESSIANYPDLMVLDLDPYLYSGQEKHGEEPELHRKGFEMCREIVWYLKEHLDRLNVRSFIKTSGKTGLHIYIPIKRNIDYDTVRQMSEILCRQILKEHPDKTTMEWAVKKRTGKVFLDHNMNARSKSLVSVYSPRIGPDALVSTPLEWNELDSVYPTDFNMRTLPARIASKADVWASLLTQKNDLKSIFGKRRAAS